MASVTQTRHCEPKAKQSSPGAASRASPSGAPAELQVGAHCKGAAPVERIIATAGFRRKGGLLRFARNDGGIGALILLSVLGLYLQCPPEARIRGNFGEPTQRAESDRRRNGRNTPLITLPLSAGRASAPAASWPEAARRAGRAQVPSGWTGRPRRARREGRERAWRRRRPR